MQQDPEILAVDTELAAYILSIALLKEHGLQQGAVT
jgi:hypothetical protein